MLEAAGIECQVRNEYVGGAAGDLSPFDVWPEIWVDEADYSRAQSILDGIEKNPEQPQWRCSRCQEMNEATFEFCWQCGAPNDSVRQN